MTLVTSREHIVYDYSTCLGHGKAATVDFATTPVMSREHIVCDYSTCLGNGKAATVDFAVVL